MNQESKLKIFEKYFLYFMMYALLGWLYEVFLEVVVYQWGFSNRGVLFGPYLPVYGFGALTFIICLRKLKNKKITIAGISLTPLIIFLGVMVIATAMELAASYAMEAVSGAWLWDYDAYPFNFDGRIALNPSIRFGIGGTIFIYFVQPAFERLVKRLSEFQLHLCFAALFITFIADVAAGLFAL
ncbi:MAG TPA: putative ABC transporter permease [Bacillota bacterium]|nr:putative ABC transporter permease [Bacillota bacterium]